MVIKALCLRLLLAAATGGAGIVAAQGSGANAAATTATATATSPARVLGLDGAPNFRDIGGYTTGDGHHVRWGEVYRSNELSKLTAADAARVDSLHIATVVDLRTDEERSRAPSVWTHEPANVYLSPKPTLAPVMHTILAEAGSGPRPTSGGVSYTLDMLTPPITATRPSTTVSLRWLRSFSRMSKRARSGLIDFYAHMPDDYRTEYAAMFHRIAAGDLPMVVHCTAGKDRTGVAMALLLTAVGVPRETVVDDYALTEKLVPPAAGAAKAPAPVGGAVPAASPLSQLPEESRRALWRSDPQYIQSALDSMQHEYGSIDAYLERGLGLSRREIRAVRTNMVD